MPNQALLSKHRVSEERCYRVILWDYLDPQLYWVTYLMRFGLSNEEATQKYQSLYSTRGTAPLLAALEFPFTEGGDGSFIEGRFNDPSFPALYSSREIETAATEFLCGLIRKGYLKSQIRFGCFTVLVTGEMWNLLDPDATVREKLLSDDWSYCQMVGRAARANADGLIAIAARRTSGTNVVVFAQSAFGLGRMIEVAEVDCSSLGSVDDVPACLGARRALKELT